MPYFAVELACIIRQTAQVIVKCKSREELAERLSDVYRMEEGRAEWSIDGSWGSDEGTHTIIGEVENPFEFVEADRLIINLDRDIVSEERKIEKLPGIEIKLDGDLGDAIVIYAKLKERWYIFDADREWIPSEECNGNASIFSNVKDAFQVLELIPEGLL